MTDLRSIVIISLRTALIALIGTGWLLGCSNGGAVPAEQATAGPTGGTLVFSDDFDRAELGDDWARGEGEHGAGTWRIDDGEVAGHALKNDPLWLKESLPEKVRVEFDITPLSPVGDAKVEIFGDGTHHASGYVLIYGGWNNSLDVIARLDEHGKDRLTRATRGVMPGVTYRMAVERTDGELRWYVNGMPFMTYDDPEPLRGDDHRFFAFSNWLAPVRFDRVRVYALP